MSGKAYKVVEVVGTSKNSIEEAIECGLQHIDDAKNSMNWFEVIETRGFISDAKVGYYQVTLKVGCKV